MLRLEMDKLQAERNDLRLRVAEIRTKNAEIATAAKACLNSDLSNEKQEKLRSRLTTLLS